MDQGNKEEGGIKVKKHTVILAAFKIVVGVLLKAQHDEVNSASVKEKD